LGKKKLELWNGKILYNFQIENFTILKIHNSVQKKKNKKKDKKKDTLINTLKRKHITQAPNWKIFRRYNVKHCQKLESFTVLEKLQFCQKILYNFQIENFTILKIYNSVKKMKP
jgi:hypothetical protein